MFISKRKIGKKHYYYLEERINGKRISLSLSKKENANKKLPEAFESMLQKITLENLKSSQKKFKTTCLSLNDLLVLERLKLEYSLIKRFFPKEFESFKEDEFVKYAQGSVSVEGNSLSLQEASLVLNKGISISGKKVNEIREIENMQRTANISKKIKEVNEKKIKKIHSSIMKGFDDENPGKYREGPIFITGSAVKPPKAEYITKEMKKLMVWFKKSKKHPIELASEFHARFEEIHPFLDGNGRTGREILNVILQNNNYPKAIINLENRQSYIILLERVQTNKEYDKFSKFVYICLEKKAKEISNIIKENKSNILKNLSKKIH